MGLAVLCRSSGHLGLSISTGNRVRSVLARERTCLRFAFAEGLFHRRRRSYYLFFYYLFFYYLFVLPVYAGTKGDGVTRICGNGLKTCYPYMRGQLHRITQACGNRRLTASDDSEIGGGGQGPTRRGKAADGPLSGRKGETSGLADLD